MKKIILLFLLLLNMMAFAQKPASIKSKIKQKPAKLLKEFVLISTSYGNMIFDLYDETPKHRDNFKKLIRQKYYDSLMFHRIIRDFMIQGGDPDSRFADSTKTLGNGGPGYTIPAEISKDIIHTRGALAAARTGDNINPNKESSGSQFYIVQGKKIPLKELESTMNTKNLQRKQQIFNDLIIKDTAMANRLGYIQQTKGKEALHEFITKQLGYTIDSIYKNKQYIYNGNQINAYKELGGTPYLDQDYTVFGQMISGFEVLDKISIVYTNPQTNRPFENIRMKISIIKR